MSKGKVLMIGCGSAAISALKELRAQGSEDEVTLISMEEHQPYSPMSLPYLVAGKKKQLPPLVRPGFFEEMKATLLTGTKVEGIDTEAKEVVLSDGNRKSYDRLLIATGSKPILQSVLQAAEVPVFHILDDCRSIQSLPQGSRVTIVGAGFVGMELAAALCEAGHRVGVVAPRERILRPYFDPDLDTYINDLFQEKGILIHLNFGEAEEVYRHSSGFKVKFTSGSSMETDLLIAATGVRPRIDFLQGSSIKTNKGILVDGRMMTNVKDVYAAGDVAETPNLLTGEYGLSLILPSAVEQGRVAGRNLAGVDSVYEGWMSMNAFNFFGHMAVSIGQFMGNPEDVILQEKNPEAREYKKLVVRDGKLIGANFFNVKVDSGVIVHLIRKQVDVTGNEDLLLEKPGETCLWLMQEAERKETLSMER